LQSVDSIMILKTIVKIYLSEPREAWVELDCNSGGEGIGVSEFDGIFEASDGTIGELFVSEEFVTSFS
jgi:hypothetical protein